MYYSKYILGTSYDLICILLDTGFLNKNDLDLFFVIETLKMY